MITRTDYKHVQQQQKLEFFKDINRAMAIYLSRLRSNQKKTHIDALLRIDSAKLSMKNSVERIEKLRFDIAKLVYSSNAEIRHVQRLSNREEFFAKALEIVKQQANASEKRCFDAHREITKRIEHFKLLLYVCQLLRK